MKEEFTLDITEGPGQGQSFTLSEGTYCIGRDASANVVLESRTASRRHAEIGFDGKRCVVRDLGSQNGTLVNGQLITKDTELQHDDVIRIGDVTLKLDAPALRAKAAEEKKAKPAVAAPTTKKKKVKLPGQKESSQTARILIAAGVLLAVILGGKFLVESVMEPSEPPDNFAEFELLAQECAAGIVPSAVTNVVAVSTVRDAFKTALQLYKNRRYREAMDMFHHTVNLCERGKKSRDGGLTPDEQALYERITHGEDLAKEMLIGQIVGRVQPSKVRPGRKRIVPGHFWRAQQQENNIDYENAVKSWELVMMAAGSNHPFYEKARHNRDVLRICLDQRISRQKFESFPDEYKRKLLSELQAVE